MSENAMCNPCDGRPVGDPKAGMSEPMPTCPWCEDELDYGPGRHGGFIAYCPNVGDFGDQGCAFLPTSNEFTSEDAARKAAANQCGVAAKVKAVKDAVEKELKDWCPNASDEIHRFAEGLLATIGALAGPCKTCGGSDAITNFINHGLGRQRRPGCPDCTGKAGG